MSGNTSPYRNGQRVQMVNRDGTFYGVVVGWNADLRMVEVKWQHGGAVSRVRPDWIRPVETPGAKP